MIFGLITCSGQEKGKEEKISEINPNTNVKVNKEYDENGNLIRYDSTYSYFYSSTEGDTLQIDSILRHFRNRFNEHYFFSEDPYFKELFFEDSLMPMDIFKQDFFENIFKFHRERMDTLFMDMDSLKNYYFRDYFRDSLLIK